MFVRIIQRSNNRMKSYLITERNNDTGTEKSKDEKKQKTSKKVLCSSSFLLKIIRVLLEVLQYFLVTVHVSLVPVADNVSKLFSFESYTEHFVGNLRNTCVTRLIEQGLIIRLRIWENNLYTRSRIPFHCFSNFLFSRKSVWQKYTSLDTLRLTLIGKRLGIRVKHDSPLCDLHKWPVWIEGNRIRRLYNPSRNRTRESKYSWIKVRAASKLELPTNARDKFQCACCP